jgi:mandelamide amidase
VWIGWTAPHVDQVGPLARVVEDLVLFDSIVTNDFAELPPVSIAGTRIGIAPRYFFDGLDGEVERVVALAIDRLKFEGVVIVEAEIPEVIAQCLDVALAIQWHEFHGSFAKFLREHQTGISLEQLFSQVAANTASDLEPGAPFPDPEGHYQNALQSRELIKKSYQRHFADNRIDALLFPPVLCPAPPLGDNRMIEIAGRPVPIRTVFGRNMAVGPCTGAPGLVLPAGLASNGLPVGIELEALPGRDRALLSLGLGVEKLLGPIPPPTACS